MKTLLKLIFLLFALNLSTHAYLNSGYDTLRIFQSLNFSTGNVAPSYLRSESLSVLYVDYIESCLAAIGSKCQSGLVSNFKLYLSYQKFAEFDFTKELQLDNESYFHEFQKKADYQMSRKVDSTYWKNTNEFFYVINQNDSIYILILAEKKITYCYGVGKNCEFTNGIEDEVYYIKWVKNTKPFFDISIMPVSSIYPIINTKFIYSSKSNLKHFNVQGKRLDLNSRKPKYVVFKNHR